MPRPKQLASENQLLVEGNDHRNFFEAMTEYLSIENIQIQDFGGVNELGRFLPAFVSMSDFDTVRSIGIVRDAEGSAQSAFQSVQSSLRRAKLPQPRRPEERTDKNPAVTVLILPNSNRPGMLETLLRESFRGTAVDQCIHDYLQCIEVLPDVSIKNQDKARTHAYLATMPNPHFSIGVAAKNGYWDFDHDVFANIRDFLRIL